MKMFALKTHNKETVEEKKQKTNSETCVPRKREVSAYTFKKSLKINLLSQDFLN